MKETLHSLAQPLLLEWLHVVDCGGARLSLPQPHGPVPTVSSSPAATVDTKGFKEKGSQFRVKGPRVWGFRSP